MQQPDDIVGHKTFDTGERDKHGLPVYRHEPLTRAEGEALWEAAKAAEAKRAEDMPTEQDAINVMFSAWQRLKELGWREAQYCPKDGSTFKVIESGSTGIFDCVYEGEWPTGTYWLHDEHDSYSSRPVMFKLLPEAQAEYDAKMAAARERYQRENA